MLSYLKGSVALRANLVLSTALGVHEMTETVKHDLVPPAKLPVTLPTSNLPSGGSLVPVHAPDHALADVELVVHLPLFQLALLRFRVSLLFFLHLPGYPALVLSLLCLHPLGQFFLFVLGKELPLLLDLLGMVL